METLLAKVRAYLREMNVTAEDLDGDLGGPALVFELCTTFNVTEAEATEVLYDLSKGTL